jgi:hypothetical protein
VDEARNGEPERRLFRRLLRLRGSQQPKPASHCQQSKPIPHSFTS